MLLLFTFLPALAWNPPGMIVRDDGQSEDTPWGEADCYLAPSDYDDGEKVNDGIDSEITIDITIVDLGIPIIFNKIIMMSITQSTQSSYENIDK